MSDTARFDCRLPGGQPRLRAEGRASGDPAAARGDPDSGAPPVVAGLVNVRGQLVTVGGGMAGHCTNRAAGVRCRRHYDVLQVGGGSRVGIHGRRSLDLLADAGAANGARVKRCPAWIPRWSGRRGGAPASRSSCSTRTRCSDPSCLLGSCVSHTVLVCDDAIFMRTMISDILAQAGFESWGKPRPAPRQSKNTTKLKTDLVTMEHRHARHGWHRCGA